MPSLLCACMHTHIHAHTKPHDFLKNQYYAQRIRQAILGILGLVVAGKTCFGLISRHSWVSWEELIVLVPHREGTRRAFKKFFLTLTSESGAILALLILSHRSLLSAVTIEKPCIWCHSLCIDQFTSNGSINVTSEVVL